MWSVFFVFLSYLDRNFVKGDFLSRALDAEKESKEMFSLLNGTFCAKMSTVRDNFFYQVSDGAEVVRSVVSPAGKLINCSVVVNQMQAKSFMHECRLGLNEHRAGRQLQTRFARMDEAKVMCREFQERSERSGRVKREDSGDSALQEKVLQRSKRGFTYPGTLWCGAGNMADNYEQLGDFADTDSCCRTHDHCPHVIHAFSSKYGYTNFKWHSICSCDCDNTLKACLRKVNDTSSRVVGQAFFNVISAPCFDLVYEEQCAERHWYGVCKRYEKLPIAVLRDAIPYDFGGIDIIDKLPLPSTKKTDSDKSREEDTSESTAQSTMSGPEEPSLTNVVTAAEDFIKVLATVSTSQSSTADSDKGETQSSEKKKRKNSAKKKKTTKKQKGKGKGRKRKPKAEAGVKVEDGAAVSNSGSKAAAAAAAAAEVNALSNFITEPHKHDRATKDTNRVGDGEFEHPGRDEPSNEVMKDEPTMDKETVTSPPTVQKKPAGLTEEIAVSASTTAAPQKANTRRQRKGGGKKNKKTAASASEGAVMNTTGISVCAATTMSPDAQQEHQAADERPVVSTARVPIVITKVKRNRSKERGDAEGRKKRRKGSPALITADPRENSSADSLKVIPLTGAPTVPSVPATRRQLSHRLDIYAAKTTVQVTSPNSSLTVLRGQKWHERGLRSRRRKKVLSLSSENALSHNSSENVPPVRPTPETNDAPSNPATAAARTEVTESHSEWRLFTTVTAAPSIITKRHRQTIARQRNPRRKAAPLTEGVSALKQTDQTPMTFTSTPSKVTTTTDELKTSTTTCAPPVMSAVQLSIERAKAQFRRKKRRKAAMRQQ